MIEEFVASWALFYKAYVSGWLIAALLSVVGVLVVARDQIFIGAAVSQASTLGIAVGLWLGDEFHEQLPWTVSDGFLATLAVLASTAAALITTRLRARFTTHEARTGWVFLATASIAILVVSNSPHGTEEIHRVLFSSIIGATTTDLVVFGSLTLITLTVAALVNRRLLLLATDPAMATAVGVRTRIWTVAESVWLGLVLGLSIRVSGVLYAFGFLVLPPLIATNLCREMRQLFVVAPLVGLATSAVGFVLAHHYDLPPAQMAIAFLSVLYGITQIRALGSDS